MSRSSREMARMALLTLTTVLLSASFAAEEARAPGLIGEYFAVRNLASDFPLLDSDLKPNFKRVDAHIDFSPVTGEFYGSGLSQRFYVRWSGFLHAPDAGKYTFYSASDDGSRIMLDGVMVVNNYGLHAMQEEEGDVTLSAGEHRILVEYIQFDGAAAITLYWRTPKESRATLPASALTHAPAEAGLEARTFAASAVPPQLFEESIEPPDAATLEEKVTSVMPRPQENLWASVSWRRSLHAARMESQLTGKPIFLWVMNGNPLGCT